MTAPLYADKLLAFRGRVGAFFGVAALTAAIPLFVALILVTLGLP
jgi:hypothetical protein